jgi:hypothetical protein
METIAKKMKEYCGFDIVAMLGDCWICGGAVRDALAGDRINDIDIYINSVETPGRLRRRIVESLEGRLLLSVKIGERVDSVKCLLPDESAVAEIQLIDYPHIRDIFEVFGLFDWRCCCVGIDGTGAIYSINGAIEDISKKELRPNNIKRSTVEQDLVRLAKLAGRDYVLTRDAARDIRAMWGIEDEQVSKVYEGCER